MQFASTRWPRPRDDGELYERRPRRLAVLAAAAIAATLPVQLAHVSHGTGGDDTGAPPNLAPEASDQNTRPGTEMPAIPKGSGTAAHPNLSPDDSSLSAQPEEEPPGASEIPRLPEDPMEPLPHAQTPSPKTPPQAP